MKKFLKVAAVFLALVIFTTGGYLAGRYTQTDSLVSALPKNINEKYVEEEQNAPVSTEAAQMPDMPPAEKQTEVNIIEKNSKTAIQEGWSEVHKSDIMLSEGQTAQIKLYTSAGKDTDGTLVYDDGNQWILEVEHGGEYYTLVNKYVQLGKVNYIAGEDENGEEFITAIISTGAGLSVERYTYNGTAFEGQVVYNSSGLNIRSSTF